MRSWSTSLIQFVVLFVDEMQRELQKVRDELQTLHGAHNELSKNYTELLYKGQLLPADVELCGGCIAGSD